MAVIRQITASQGPALFLEFEKLLAQLSPDALPPTADQMNECLTAQNVMVLGAFENEELVGTATLILLCLLNKTVGHIESVVVDQRFRKRGIGKQLIKHMLIAAHARNTSTCTLTCPSHRTEASALYLQLGFRVRDTNVYRYQF